MPTLVCVNSVVGVACVGRDKFLIRAESYCCVFSCCGNRLPGLSGRGRIVIFYDRFRGSRFGPRVFKVLSSVKVACRTVLTGSVQGEGRLSSVGVACICRSRTCDLSGRAGISALLSGSDNITFVIGAGRNAVCRTNSLGS